MAVLVFFFREQISGATDKIQTVVKELKTDFSYMYIKTKSFILAYQKLYAMTRLSQPLPLGSLKIINDAQPLSFE